MKNGFSTALLLLVALSVVADPYTLHLNASDAQAPAPFWQTAAAIGEVALLVAAAAILLRGKPRLAQILVGAATLWNLAYNIIYVRRDGVSRFLAGFGAQEFLSLYLASMAVRIVLLVWLTRPPAGARSSDLDRATM